MRVSAIICSVGRPEVLHDTVESLMKQSHGIEEVLIGSPSAADVRRETGLLPGVKIVRTAVGLTIQRNTCLSEVCTSSDLIAFFDDDVELSTGYVKAMVDLFAADPDLVASSGTLLYDGGLKKSIARADARRLCATIARRIPEDSEICALPRDFAYGCNMVFRCRAISGKRFDEQLPLYGWLEDSDFSHNCTKSRKGPVTNYRAYAVHLGWRGGRVAGRRLGFSQIMNPIYLWKKSRVFTLSQVVMNYWARCIVGNILGLVSGEPIEDRPGRVIGNLIGIIHLLKGEIDPGYAARLQVPNKGKASVANDLEVHRMSSPRA